MGATPEQTGPLTVGLVGPYLPQLAVVGSELFSLLAQQRSEVGAHFVDLTVEVPEDNGPRARRAAWRLNGSLRTSLIN